MFSTRLSRVATCTVASASVASSPSAAAAHRATTCSASRPRASHQRRASSSKSSCPSDSNSSSKPAPATKTANAVVEGESSALSPALQRIPKRANRTKRSKSAGAGDKLEDRFAGLPAVPGTQHLSQSDLSVSSFFSLHRPLSLKHAVPPISSLEAFNGIFEPRKQADPWANGNSAEGTPEDVVYALGSLFDNLDHGSRQTQDDGMRWEIIQESTSNHEGVKHLDGPPPRHKTMEELVSEFRPFNAPPPPEPFVAERKTESKRKLSKAKSKSYEATIIVTEFTAGDGSKRYTASSSPIVRIPSPDEVAHVATQRSRSAHRERRLERSRAFWLRQKGPMQEPSQRKHKMLLISVKRQRKLKMKKHKYKKLMKRTRNLRRRQDRA